MTEAPMTQEKAVPVVERERLLENLRFLRSKESGEPGVYRVPRPTLDRAILAVEDLARADEQQAATVAELREAAEAAESWLRECSSWLLTTDLDMQCPMETDPLDIADLIAAALAKVRP